MATVDWSNQKLQKESPLSSEEYVVKAMPSILNTLDMTALYLVSIFFIVNAVSAAGAGPAGFTYWLLCLIIAAIGGMFATSEAAWEGLSNK